MILVEARLLVCTPDLRKAAGWSRPVSSSVTYEIANVASVELTGSMIGYFVKLYALDYPRSNDRERREQACADPCTD